MGRELAPTRDAHMPRDGSCANGGLPHLATEMFKTMATL
jgi:hypothetical protein